MSGDFQKGWTTAKLVEIFDFKYGKGLPQETRNKRGTVRVYGSNGIVGVHSHAVTKGPTIIIGRKGSVGEVHLSTEGCWPIDTTYFIDEYPGQLPPKYWAYFLKSLRLGDQEKSSAIPGISRSDIYEVEVPLPPLEEQRRIVEKLEMLLVKVETCQKRLDKIPVILKRFRQSVLAAASTGRLTTDWREKTKITETVAELFTNIQSERQRLYEKECKQADVKGKRKPKQPDTNKKSRNVVSDLPELPDSWEYYRLEELCHLVTDGTHKTPKYQSTGKAFLSVKNVRPFLVRDDDIKFISKEEHEWINARCNPEKGDILYTKVGATFGYAAVNDRNYPFSIFVSLALLKPVRPFFSSAYAELVMNSEIIFNQARERVTGIGTPDLHLIEIRDFRTPVPPLVEQEKIVYRVQALFVFADQIEARYAKAKAHVDKITQSILAKAFRGELVPQDPNDEPAEVLLNRIREGLLADAPAKRKKGMGESDRSALLKRRKPRNSVAVKLQPARDGLRRVSKK